MSAGLRTNYFDGGATPVPGEIVASDMNAISAAVNSLFPSSTSTASSATTLTLTAASDPVQVITGNTAQPVVLPTTLVAEGDQWMVVSNMTTAVITVTASGGATVTTIAPGTAAVFTALVATPTTAANWLAQYAGTVVAAGKVLTVNNTVTLGGTDGTTYNLDSLAPGTEVVTVSAATSLTLTTASTCYVFAGASGTTWTLPAVAGNTGKHLILENRGSSSITLIPAGADRIWYLAALTTFPIIAGGSLHLVNDGTYWETLSVDLTDNVAGVLAKTNGGTGSATGALTPPAGTTAVAPIALTAGTNLTTPAAGALEYDGNVFYQTPKASTRHVLMGEQFCTLTAAYTLTSQTAAQKIFNASTNGAVTLAIGSYFFECFFAMTGLSATSGSFGFGFGGAATISSQIWWAAANKATALATAGAALDSVNTAAVVGSTTTGIAPANTSTTGWAHIRGKLVVSVAGTVIPQVTLGVAAAAVVSANSWFRIVPVGLNTVTTVGNWS